MNYLKSFIFAIFVISFCCISARDFVHINSSKGIYETSEDLWFKGLVLDQKSYRLSDMSHTAYIKLVDPEDSVVLNEKFPVINGQIEGHIYVGDDWMQGEYRLYAFTRNSIEKGDTILYPH